MALAPGGTVASELRSRSLPRRRRFRPGRRPRREREHHELRDNVGGLRRSSMAHVNVVPVPMQYPRDSQRSRMPRTRVWIRGEQIVPWPLTPVQVGGAPELFEERLVTAP